jgi:rod shape-determining protein MreC
MKDRARIPIFVASALLVLILISIGQHRYTLKGLEMVQEGYSWVERITSAPLTFFSDIWDGYIYLINTEQENVVLKKKISALEVQNMAFKELRSENDRLRGMLELKKAYQDLPLRPAAVISQDITLVFKTIIIDKGSRDGFYKNMPIIKSEGLVGRTILVSPNTSQVLLITDVNSAVPAMIENSRVKGIVKGRGDGNLTLEYVRSDEDVKVGDVVVTSGLAGIFPKGINIGTIRSIKRVEHKMFAEIMLRPSVKIGRIEEIFGIGRDVAYSD